jgi:hypothetical protein
MTFAEFRRSLSAAKPPRGLSPALAALWWAKKDDWHKAHAAVMDETDKACAWVHAHLHRVEGDLDNARYWYRRAGRPAATQSSMAEWEEIARALLREAVS